MSASVSKGAAHYSSTPVIYDAPQLPRTRVERVDLKTIPLNLPVPPMTGFTPVYPSQEDTVFSTQKQQDRILRITGINRLRVIVNQTL